MKPAIVVVGYNRPKDMERLLNSIDHSIYDSTDIPLIISIDKAPNESDVVDVAKKFKWKYGKKEIRTFPERQGLRNHIIQCGDLSEKYGAVIILEDDLIVSPYYYAYVLQALEFYKNEDKIAGIALYSHEWNGYGRRFFTPVADEYDSFMGQFSITWGQCWTDKSWSKFKKWYVEHSDQLKYNPLIPTNINHWSNKSWGKYFVNYIVEKDLYYVIPRIALSTNCSDVGEHVKIQDNSHQVRLLMTRNKQYHFPSFNDAWHYDIFFENQDLANYLPEGVNKQDTCIDLTGVERTTNKRFILSTRSLPYVQIKKYSLQLRPIEMNVIMDLDGNEIYLYDTTEESSSTNNNLYNILKYEVRGFNFKDIGVLFINMMIDRIRNKLHK